MRIFLADSLHSKPLIDLISLKSRLYQSRIEFSLNSTASMEKSDIVLIPHDVIHFHDHKPYVSYLKSLAKHKLVVFSNRGDFPIKIRLSNAISLRVALNPGENRNNKIVVPYNVESLDFLPLKPFESKPRISFVGYAPRVSIGRIYRTLKQSPLHPISGNGAAIRHFSTKQLEKSRYRDVVVRRNQYGADATKVDSQEFNRKEFLNSLNHSDFFLSPRGDANQSARFYETLSAGKTPIVPFTGMVYPSPLCKKNALLDSYIVQYSIARPQTLDHRVLRIWNSFQNSKQYMEHQLEVRNYFRNNLDYSSYMRKLFSLKLDEFLRIANYVK